MLIIFLSSHKFKQKFGSNTESQPCEVIKEALQWRTNKGFGKPPKMKYFMKITL